MAVRACHYKPKVAIATWHITITMNHRTVCCQGSSSVWPAAVHCVADGTTHCNHMILRHGSEFMRLKYSASSLLSALREPSGVATRGS